MLPRRRIKASAGWLAAGLTGLFIACGTTSPDPAGAGAKAGSSTGATHSGATTSGGSPAGPAGEGAGATSNTDAGMAASGSPSAGSTAAAGEAGMGSSVGGARGGVPPGGAECEGDESACDARGIQAKAICRSKRCVFDLSCDRSSVTCKAAEPECEAGQVPSVIDTCWGPCIDVAQCRDVTDCTACAAGQVCVRNNDSPFLFTQCVAVEAACSESPTCACTDACSFSCDETNGIGCFCVVC